MVLVWLLGINVFAAHASGPGVDVLRMVPKQSETDVSHAFLMDAVTAAMENTVDDFGPYQIEMMPIPLNQGLILHLLEFPGVLDLVASAPTEERETTFRAIRVPLMMGLLGYRMMLVHPDRIDEFNSFTKPEQLKSLVACQGAQWPDADLLENQGYRVYRVEGYEEMFHFVRDGTCDYFPRAITEGYGELEAFNQKHPDAPLAKFDRILLHYFVPLYFFTGQHNYELAARIELGLQRAIDSGELKKLLEQNPVTQSAFPLSKWKESIVFKVANPDLSKSTPIYQAHYWLQIPATVYQP
ncbi:transporter substrate-binding domain-containing protein [Corallincola platygyrae]